MSLCDNCHTNCDSRLRYMNCVRLCEDYNADNESAGGQGRIDGVEYSFRSGEYRGIREDLEGNHGNMLSEAKE